MKNFTNAKENNILKNSIILFILGQHIVKKAKTIFSDASNKSFLLRNDERERKYEAAREPFKRFRFITQQLCASENEKSKSDSESSMNYKLQLQILKNIKCKNIEVKKKK